MSRREHAFTLIEMLVVVMFTSIVMVVAVDFFLQLGRATSAATEATRDGRRAAAILDRVSRDLESAVLVDKAEEADPLEHPWLFLAERGSGSAGSERLLFTRRGRVPRASASHESDLERVAYFVEEDETGSPTLMRWSSPRLPESLERDLPRGGDEGSAALAHQVGLFGVRLLDEEGEWLEEWDSSTLVRSGELPLAAEISVALLPSDPIDDGFEQPEPRVFRRLVQIPVRPLDLAAELSGGEEGPGEGEDDEEADDTAGSGKTVAECAALLGFNLALLPGVDPQDSVANNVHLVPPDLRPTLGPCLE